MTNLTEPIKQRIIFLYIEKHFSVEDILYVLFQDENINKSLIFKDIVFHIVETIDVLPKLNISTLNQYPQLVDYYKIINRFLTK